MNALLSFLVGLFTRHLGTKFLALMLAIILFVVVRQQNERTWRLDELVLQFKLEEGLESEWVLIDREVRLTNLKLQGIPGRDGPQAVRLQEDKVKPYTLTRKFLDRYGADGRIEVTESLLEEILGGGLGVEGLTSNYYARFDRLDEQRMEVTYQNTEQEAQKLVLPENHPYRAAGSGPLQPRFSCPPTVSVRGPRRAFQERERRRLYVVLPDFAAALQGIRTDEESLAAEFPVDGVDWSASGIALGDLDFVTVDGVRAAAFAESLIVTVDVTEQQDSRDLTLPIHQLTVRGGVDPEQWRIGGLVVTTSEFEAGKANKQLKMPRTLARDEEFLGRLVLVFDFARASRTPEELIVPVRLYVRDEARPEDFTKLRRITLQGETAESFVPNR